MNRQLQRISFYELVRFACVGVLATIIHYALYCLLRVYIHYNIAYTIGYGVSFMCNYLLTSYFTFRQKATIKNGIGFSGAHIMNYILQMVLLNLIISIGVKKEFAPIPVYCIAIPVNYCMVRYVFKSKKIF